MEKIANKNAAMKETPGKAKNGTASARKRYSSRKIKNLEEEVELILSQEENDDLVMDNHKKAEEKGALTATEGIKQIAVTPRRRTAKFEPDVGLQTPRRSVRKSVKPAQDYEDIVVKKTMRSMRKDEKQSSAEDGETEMGSDEKSELQEIPDPPKWTPAKVGRGSQKRRKRKSRKTNGKQNSVEQLIGLEEELLIAIENDEDENKENVSPQDLLKQKKLSKDMENSKINTRNQEMANSAEKKRRSLQDTVLKPLDIEQQANIFEKEQVDVNDKIVDENAATQTVADLEPLEIQNQARTQLSEHNDNSVTGFVTELVEVHDHVSAEVDSLAPVTVQEPNLLVPENSQNSQANHQTKNEPILVDIEEKKDIFNATFNASLNESDCIIITPVHTPKTETVNTEELAANISSENEDSDCVMQSLLLSEDEDENSNDQNYEVKYKKSEDLSPTAAKKPKITITTDEIADVTLLSPKINKSEDSSSSVGKKLKITITTDEIADVTLVSPEVKNKSEDLSPTVAKKPKITISTDKIAAVTLVSPAMQTPKQRPKPYRFPTPYKSRDVKNLSFEFNKNMPDEDDVQENLMPPTVPPSVKKSQVVAKTPVSIMKLTKLEPREIVLRSIHRKRSLSECADRTQNKSMNRVKFHSPANQTTFIDDLDLLITKSASKRKVDTSVMRKRGDVAAPDTTNVTKRHKRSLSFDESIIQMRRKAQQAPLTPNKSKGTPLKPQRTKIPNFAIIHQRQFNKMENLMDHLQRKADRAKVLTTSSSKVRTASAQKVGNQKVETVFGAGATGSNAISNVVKPKALKKIDLNDITVTSGAIENDENPPQNPNLPDPKLFLQRNLAVVKPLQLNKTQQKAAASTKKPMQETQKKRIVTLSKPPFSLSTHIKNNDTSNMVLDKVVTRRQRHMDLFKSRKEKDQENASEIIRGVRSNRRFQLQMQHRKNLEHHTE